MRLSGGVSNGLCLLIALASGDAAAAAPDDGETPLNRAVDFDRDVRPVLSDVCYGCHGPDAGQRKADLRLDTRAGAFVEREGRRVVVPGDPGASELYRRITAEDEEERMPPPEAERRLTAEEIERIRLWIAAGAEWREHWAFVAPVRHAPPPVRAAATARGPIDRFVGARLDAEGLRPAPEAGRETLIRRVALDLTGLPPELEEVDAFLADRAPDAYERAADRLLASPRHGERMAGPWLDAARYADTSGYQTDGPRFMWRWRDWVIDAFNSGMPFDRFTVEQIAGDMLPAATLEQRIATGFNRNHRGNAEGGIIAEEFQVEYVVDRVDTTATVWLGLTMGCARCHEHKYDPITQEEFYRVFAYFNNVPEHGRAIKHGNSVPWIPAPTPEQRQALAALDCELAEARDRFAALEPRLARAQRKWERSPAGGGHEPWTIEEGLELRLAADGGAPAGGEHPDAGDFGYFDRFSVAAWIVPEGAGEGAIVSRVDDPVYSEGWELCLRDGRVQLNLVKRWLDDAIRVETTDPIEPGHRHHVLATYDGSRVAGGIAIWVDGERRELDVLLDELNQSFESKEPLRVGTRGSGGAFRGAIDEVRIYSRALPPEEARILAVAEEAPAIAALPPERRTGGQRLKLRRLFLERHAPAAVRSAWLRMRELEARRAALLESFPTLMVMEEMATPRETHVLERGRYDRPGERVEPGVPGCLPPLPRGAANDRLGFARWLAAAENPLTARVTVNRLWQMLFGAGIVRTVEDFGAQGERPVHPRLLDWLATELVRVGWDVKTVLRTMVSSATYRRTSRASAELLARDPENRLLARAPRVRLSARALRDQALAASGLLVERLGGPSVKPYQPPGIWEELSGVAYEQDHGEALYRRSLYTYWKRTAAPPAMSSLDAADREWCTVRQTRTNTPLQALTLMNDVTFVEAARVMAQRLMRELDAPAARIERAFRLATGRRPGARELAVLLDGYREHLERYRGDREAALALASAGEYPRDEGLDVAEHAALAAVANLILNLDETLTRG